MSKTLLTALGVLAGIAAVAADGPVGLGHPDFYGRIELGDDSPRPEVYFEESRLVEPVAEFGDFIYLRVRPGESEEWELRCHFYEACGRYVYFVNDDWYLTVYVPYYRGRHDPRYDEGQIDSARRAEEHRDDHRNDELRGEPGDENGA